MELSSSPVDSSLREDMIRRTAVTCLEKNMEIYSKLCIFEENLIHRLKTIRKRRHEIDNTIHIGSNPPPIKPPKTFDFLKPSELYRYPYFQNGKANVPPPNMDTLNNEIKINYFPACWMYEEKHKLQDLIKNIETERFLERYRPIREALTKQLKECTDKLKAERIRTEISKFSWANIRTMEIGELIKCSSEPYNWESISKDLGSVHSAIECQSMWNQYLHPKFNRGHWTHEEGLHFIQIVDRYKAQNWDAIANDLGTNRSGYMCFLHYQGRMIKQTSQWTAEEAAFLIKVVQSNSNKKGDVINWDNVQSQIPNKTKQQIIWRWHNSSNPAMEKGKFTASEHRNTLAGIRKYGHDALRIQQFFIPQRTTVQIRSYIKRIINESKITRGCWTAEENELVLELVERYGKNWQTISKHFLNRTSQQIRFRFNVLKKYIPKLVNKVSDSSKEVSEPRSHHAQVPQLKITKPDEIPFIREIDRHIIEYFRVIWKRFAKKANHKHDVALYANVINNYLIALDCKLIIPQNDSEIVLEDFSSNEMMQQCLAYIRDNNLQGSAFSASSMTNACDEDIDCPAVDAKLLTDCHLSFIEPLSQATNHTPIQISSETISQQSETVLDKCIDPSGYPRVYDSDEFDQDSASRILESPTNNTETSNILTARNHTDDEKCSLDSVSDQIELLRQKDRKTYPGRSNKCFMPPNAQTVVAFRALLLSRHRLESDANEAPSTFTGENETEAGRRAKRMWLNRMETLFSFPSLMSTYSPQFTTTGPDGGDESVVELQDADVNLMNDGIEMKTPQDQEEKPKRKQGRPTRKYKKKVNAPSRQYVRSGKYVKPLMTQTPVTDIRRSSRKRSVDCQEDSESKRSLQDSLSECWNEGSTSQCQQGAVEESRREIKLEAEDEVVEVSKGRKRKLKPKSRASSCQEDGAEDSVRVKRKKM